MSLFRFNTTTLSSLSEALRTGLEGLGAPEHTIMSLWEDHEYYLFDRRWGFGFHTFIAKHDAVYDELFGRVCRHLSYLKEKLLEDLREADKVFVISLDEPTLDGLQELHSTLTTYGPVRLLCVTPLGRCASFGHEQVEVGDIVELRPTLHVGYLSWLGRGAIGWRIQFEEWLSIFGRYMIETLQDRSGALVFDGDSIAVSHGVPAGDGLADQVAAALAFGGKMTVVGAGGRSVEECMRLFADKVVPLRRSGPNVIFFHAGDNDIDKGASARTVYDRLTLYIDQAHRAGWKVVVSTELQRFDFPLVWQGELSAYNAAILANEAGADGIVDFNGDPIMGGPENRTDCSLYQQDGVHPTSQGYAGLAKSTVAELRRHFQ